MAVCSGTPCKVENLSNRIRGSVAHALIMDLQSPLYDCIIVFLFLNESICCDPH